MKRKIAIIGSSDLAQLVIHHAILTKQFIIYGIYDDYSLLGKCVSEIPVLGTLEDVEKDFAKKNFDCLFIAVGYSRMQYRASVFNRFSGRIPFANIIHESCNVDPSVELGEGVFLFPGVILDKGVKIGNNVLLNVRVTIAHDSTVDNHCFFGPCVNIAGFSHICEKCYIGTNATVIDNINICSGVIIGAGAVTVKDVIEPGIYIGVPSKKMKQT